MKPQNPFSITTATTAVLLLFLHLTAAASPPAPPPSPPPSLCSDELVKFSLCLPYISSSPNNLTETPSRECCDDCASAFSAGNGVCLCYLIRQPLILGFPINSSRLLSLTSLCPINDKATKANFSLDSLCSGTSTLPPLNSIRGPERSRSRPHPPPRPPRSNHNNSLPPLRSSPPESFDGFFAPQPAVNSPAESSLLTPPSSSATKKINKKYRCVLPGIITFLVHIITKPLVYTLA